MLCRLCVILISMLCAIWSIFPTIGYTFDRVKVVILPFEIHAQKELSYLKSEAPKIIKQNLAREGADAIVSELEISSWKKKAETMDQIRNFGIEQGADYVIWGSLTWIGQQFSLDAKMIESFDENPPLLFFLEGQKLENLSSVLQELTKHFALKLFKKEKVSSVLIEGNKRIEDEAIKRVIKTKPGDIYLAKTLSEDLKAVYAMGYFDDIRIEAEKGPDGKIIRFRVKEKQTVRVIRIKGNKAIKDDKIKEVLDIKTGSILNIFKIQSNQKRIETLYKEKNYHNVRVSYQIKELKDNQSDLDFIIKENKKLLIRKIIFEGNKAYSDRKLKKLMETS
ncbi:POTRA domain-containing protein, partial [Thermodesulfobacteriota bacterium]